LLSYAKKFLHIYLVADLDSDEEKKAYEQAANTELIARLVTEGKMDEFIEKMEEKKVDTN
jgi:DnaJ-domain-containing protein 1